MKIQEQKRIFGNPLIGVWYDPTTKEHYTPNYLRDHAVLFDWKASKPDYPNNLYPHRGDTPLEYDEEV